MKKSSFTAVCVAFVFLGLFLIFYMDSHLNIRNGLISLAYAASFLIIVFWARGFAPRLTS